MLKALLPLFFVAVACSPKSGDSDDAGATDTGSGDPNALAYTITNLTGSYGGTDVNTESATEIDTFVHMTCTSTSSGTDATQSPMLANPALLEGLPSSEVGIDVTHTCPSGSCTSTISGTCTVDPLSATGPFLMQMFAAGWSDDSVVTITTFGTPPGGVTDGCNYGSVIEDTGHPWNVTGTTTVGAFRGTAPFDVHFQGAQTLTWQNDKSDVEWDFTITFQPQH
jgi:hypothetical protein